MHFCLVFLGTLIALLSSTLSHASEDSQDWQWKQLDTTKSLTEVFSLNSSSFNIQNNFDICTSTMTSIVADPAVLDYADVFQTHLDSMKETGGALELSSGRFPISKTILLPSHTCIIGNGSKETTIQVTENYNFDDRKGVLESKKSERVTLYNFTLTGPVDSAGNIETVFRETEGLSGVYFDRVNYVWVRNVVSHRHSKHGFFVKGSRTKLSTHIFFEACGATENLWSGFKVASTAYASVFNAMANRNGRAGVAIMKNAKATYVRSNQIYNTGGRGRGCAFNISSVDRQSPSDVKLMMNTMVNSSHAGVCANGVIDLNDHLSIITNNVSAVSYCYDLANVHGFVVREPKCNVIDNKRYFIKTFPYPSMEPSSSSSPSPSPNSYNYGCADGISTFDVCCPMSCEKCSDTNCDLSDEMCCPIGIRKSSNARNCTVNSPPCLLVQ